jgi:hypothetical protein
MDLLTLATISGIAALSAIILIKVRNTTRLPVQDNIAAARERAAEKARARAFAPTQPFDDFVSIHSDAVEICDKYDGRGELTPEQRRIIDLVMSDIGKVETIEMSDPWVGRNR